MLIDKTEIAKHRQISQSVRDDKINPFIEDAEFLDLKNLLGELLYNDITTNPNSANNVKLMDPLTYTYDGNEYRHQGLKKVLSIFAYARYVMFGSNTDTPFGVVNKRSQDSDNVGTDQLKIIYKKDQQVASQYYAEVRRYIERNVSDYPAYPESCQERSSGKIRINKITI